MYLYYIKQTQIDKAMKNAKEVIKEINKLLSQGWSTIDAALFMEEIGFCKVENKSAIDNYTLTSSGKYKNQPVLVCADKRLKF